MNIEDHECRQPKPHRVPRTALVRAPPAVLPLLAVGEVTAAPYHSAALAAGEVTTPPACRAVRVMATPCVAAVGR